MKLRKTDKKSFNIILGITGGIAAYKCHDLARLFVKNGHAVKVVLTRHARKFVTPLTLETLSGDRVYTNLFSKDPFSTEHITLSKWGDVLLVAPATANIIGKFASGIADDVLSTLFLSFAKPVVIAPAMHSEMYSHKIVSANIERLKNIGINFIPPETGELASGDWGEGRMPDPQKIMDFTISTITKKKDLRGKKVLITAGPTRENIDPVRHISSPSSGKMGVALAREASIRGANVTLVHGPISVDPDFSMRRISVTSAKEMNSAVLANKNCDIFISSAAVSDFSPKKFEKNKIKKSRKNLSVELKPNIDILENFSRKYGRGKVLVGFAAESTNLLRNAKEKLKKKRLDVIVANDISQKQSGFESDLNRAVIIDKNGHVQKLPLMPKETLAGIILDRISGIRKR